jgi:tektin-2
VYESVRLRESIFHTIGQSSADLESQGKASEYALRKRLHELERSLKELEWQKKQVVLCFFLNCYSFISLFILF